MNAQFELIMAVLKLIIMRLSAVFQPCSSFVLILWLLLHLYVYFSLLHHHSLHTVKCIQLGILAMHFALVQFTLSKKRKIGTFSFTANTVYKHLYNKLFIKIIIPMSSEMQHMSNTKVFLKR